MRAFLQQFAGCVELLRALPPAPADAPSGSGAGGDSEMAPAEAGAASAAVAGGAAVGTFDPVKAYRASVEGVVGTFLVLMTNMRCVCGWWVLLGAARVGRGAPEQPSVHLHLLSPAAMPP
jgi:hypothetical protein